jgi:hypothetical protein
MALPQTPMLPNLAMFCIGMRDRDIISELRPSPVTYRIKQYLLNYETKFCCVEHFKVCTRYISV